LVFYIHCSAEREQDTTYKIKRVNRLCKERGIAANRGRAEEGKNTEKSFEREASSIKQLN